MSPEQLRGAGIDFRSDIFSLGVVLYEMAAGRRPFTGESGVDVISAILNDDPEPLTGPCRELAPALENVIERCLKKDPQARYPAVGDLLQELEAIDQGPRAASAARAARALGTIPFPPVPPLEAIPRRSPVRQLER